MKSLRADRFHILSSVLFMVVISATSEGSSPCDGREVCELSEDNRKCTVTRMESATAQCCLADSCNSSGRGMLDPGSLEVRINYTAANAANIVVQWDYTTGGAATFPLQISVTQMGISESELESLCLCLPLGVTTFVTTLHYPRQVCQTLTSAASTSVKVQLLASPALQSPAVTASKEVTVSDCWSTMGKMSQHVCGPAIPSPPQHVTAVVTQAGTESTTIQVTWVPPVEGDNPIIVYDVDLKTNLLLSPSIQVVPGNVTTYSLVFGHPITPANDPIILVRAGVRWSIFYFASCRCCLQLTRGKEQYIFGHAGNSSVRWPEQASEDHKLIIIAVPSVLTCALIIVSILVGVVIVALVIRRQSKWNTTRLAAKDTESLVSDSVKHV